MKKILTISYPIAACKLFAQYRRVDIPGSEIRKSVSALVGGQDYALQTSLPGKGYRTDFSNKPGTQPGEIEIHTTALNAGAVGRLPYTHVQEEIVLILSGKVTMHIPTELTPAAAGDLVSLPPGIPHALNNTEQEQYEYFANGENKLV